MQACLVKSCGVLGVSYRSRYRGDAATTNGISSLMRIAIMSRAMRSPGRIPASKRAATMSTYAGQWTHPGRYLDISLETQAGPGPGQSRRPGAEP